MHFQREMWTGLLTLVIRPSVWDTAQALTPVHWPSHFVSVLPPSVLVFLICFLWGNGFNLVQNTSTLDTFKNLKKLNNEYGMCLFISSFTTPVPSILLLKYQHFFIFNHSRPAWFCFLHYACFWGRETALCEFLEQYQNSQSLCPVQR